MSHSSNHIATLHMSRALYWLALGLFAVVIAVGFSTPASAYFEDATSTAPADTISTSCNLCHGRESGATSPTVAPRPDINSTAKGPHGGYTVGTSKCAVCHSVHQAPAEGELLLPAATVAATCQTCHDGTGGGGVYGVIQRRTGAPAAGGHRIGYVNQSNGLVTVPGGDPSGGSLDRSFSADNNGLTCTDCHSPHDATTVQPFIGDRTRSQDSTSASVATDRLLRTNPGSTDATTSVYGTEWCEGCHLGSGMGHPVATMSTTITANYNSVRRLAGYDTSAVAGTAGPLGGSNFGYVMPPSSSDRQLPICQQCHEDARSVANDMSKPFEVSSTTESFTPSLDGATGGNPTFQNFPHETANDMMLIEPNDSLCLNCHAAGTNGSAH